MRVVFWTSAVLIIYTYVGYPFVLYLRSRFHRLQVASAPILPSVSIVMTVHNEADHLPRKLANLADVDYERELLELIVISDGSTDATNEIICSAGTLKVRPIILTTQVGKASALNHGVASARGEIVVFVDVRQTISRAAIRNLVRNFADSTVGCVSGELVLSPAGDEQGEGMSLYWRIDKAVRKLESITASVVGATGAIYAVRRELIPVLPVGTLLDDVYIPMHVAKSAKRVVFESKAVAFDRCERDMKLEFRRKVRTLTGNYQLMQLAPWLLSRANPLLFEFVSHKLLRLAVPFALALTLVTSLLLNTGIYSMALYCQIGVYALAAVALVSRGRLPNAALTFVVLNVAAAAAFVNFMTRKKPAWGR